MATAGEKPYEGAGGSGGKFRKRPFRKTHKTTPYDRPPTAVRNPTIIHGGDGSRGRWFSRLVDPASRLITASAYRLFGSVFRKRLPPPQPLASPSGTEGEPEQEDVLRESVQNIDHLMALLHSRTVDTPVANEKRPEVLPLLPVAIHERREELTNDVVQDNRVESHRSLAIVSTPVVNARVLEEDVASPAELAKAYMGSRPSKVSPSMLGLRSQPLRQDAPLLDNQPLASHSPIISRVPNSSFHGALENGFTTGRSRGRSAIYSMARTPYSRGHLAGNFKGAISVNNSNGRPSLSSSQFTGEENSPSESKQMVLKRRSSVLDNDIGSVGPIRRIRQKPNLLSSRNLSIPSFGNTQLPISSVRKLHISSESNHNSSKLLIEDGGNSIASTSLAPVPNQSTEMAERILQQLDKMVSPKEKSSELKLAIGRDKSPTKLTSNMLHGQALRSLENVDSSKILHDVLANDKGDAPLSSNLPGAQDSNSPKPGKVEENGPRSLVASSVRNTLHMDNGYATHAAKNVASTVKATESSISDDVANVPQKKRAFKMSAHEDFVELDDGYSNGPVPAPAPVSEEREKPLSTGADSNLVAAKTVALEKPPVSSEIKTLPSFIVKKTDDVESVDRSVVAEKKTGFTFPTTKTSGIVQEAFNAPQTTSTSDRVLPAKETSSASSIFSSKVSDKVPTFSFTSSSASEFSVTKFGAERKIESSVTVGACAISSIQSITESEEIENKKPQTSDDTSKLRETAVSSTGALTSAASIFSINSAPTNKLGLANGSLQSSSPIFSSSASVLTPIKSTSQPLFSSSTLSASTSATTADVAATTGASTTTFTNFATTSAALAPAPMLTFATSSSSESASAVSPFPASPIFKFGGSTPQSSVSQLPVTSVVEDSEVKTKLETLAGSASGSPFGGTFSTGSAQHSSTGSGIFSFGASASSSATDNKFQSPSLFSASSGSLAIAQASTAASGASTSGQSVPIQFGSSASAPVFGLTGTTSFTSSNTLFGSSTPATQLFGSGSVFGANASSSSSETSTVASSSGTTPAFGDSWQPSKSPIFGTTSTFSTSPSTGFSFGAPTSAASSNSAPMMFGASTGSSSNSMFSFTSAAAASSSMPSFTPSQPAFGTSNPFQFGIPASGNNNVGNNNNDQMTMEDSMAEDTMQASTPPAPAAAPVFGQSPISASSSGFVFGSAAPTGANPFQFGSQQNSSLPQSPSPFQASGSLEYGGGGSFSLGTGDNKSVRKFIKVKHNRTRKK
ncbi:hypothetical protein RJ641_005210 [Dillenia turbinata]|uniref:Nuclear pore complex protein NUP1 n=1 Tax=Dillenia turbinata TaxID=194707 RepID=A0AAN8V7H0_9MAGN